MYEAEIVIKNDTTNRIGGNNNCKKEKIKRSNVGWFVHRKLFSTFYLTWVLTN